MRTAILLILIIGSFISFLSGNASAQTDGQALFQLKCSQCHTIGEGRKVGPDLYGITQIRPFDYLVDLISNATHMFETGNQIALMVLGQYRTIRMPDLKLSREQVVQILDYIQEESAKPRPPLRAEPIPGNPDSGKKLFDGNTWFKRGGPPCISCHNISKLPFPMGGTMGPDLTGINAQFAAVNAPHVFPTMIPLYLESPLQPEEQRDLLAFIIEATFEQSTDVTAILGLLAEVAFALSVLGVYLIWRKRLGVVRHSLKPGGFVQRDGL